MDLNKFVLACRSMVDCLAAKLPGPTPKGKGQARAMAKEKEPATAGASKDQAMGHRAKAKLSLQAKDEMSKEDETSPTGYAGHMRKAGAHGETSACSCTRVQRQTRSTKMQGATK